MKTGAREKPDWEGCDGENAPGVLVKAAGMGAQLRASCTAHLQRAERLVYCLPHSVVGFRCHRQKREPGT